jgi:hypothetical protein
MEASIALHFSTLRKVCAEYSGHESSTEVRPHARVSVTIIGSSTTRATLHGCNVDTQGDSIIIGFHTPLDALKAALLAQQALLQASWPEALLAHPLCAPQYALPRGTALVDQVCPARVIHDGARRIGLQLYAYTQTSA